MTFEMKLKDVLEEGKAEGKIESIIEAVTKNFITKENAASMLKISPQELDNLLKNFTAK